MASLKQCDKCGDVSKETSTWHKVNVQSSGWSYGLNKALDLCQKCTKGLAAHLMIDAKF